MDILVIDQMSRLPRCSIVKIRNQMELPEVSGRVSMMVTDRQLIGNQCSSAYTTSI